VRHHAVVGDGGVRAIGWIREIVLDSSDPWALARFWARLLGGTPVEWYPGWVTLEPPPNGQRLSFQGVAGEATARRHDGTTQSAGVHFDIFVGSLDSTHDRVIAAGGTFVSEHVSPRSGPDGEAISWRVYRDPAGHLFCLVVR
jgi:hypothetical protein